ncbi:MAG: amidohydrolase, partial [Chloroflexota bacterium]|nr:amidohydrolase [Chloroflexota bacterium]
MADTDLFPHKQSIFAHVDRNAEAIAQLGDAIYYFGELGMQERRSAGLMADVLEEHGFEVARGISGMPTAFLASYGSGAPVIAVHT